MWVQQLHVNQFKDDLLSGCLAACFLSRSDPGAMLREAPPFAFGEIGVGGFNHELTEAGLIESRKGRSVSLSASILAAPPLVSERQVNHRKNCQSTNARESASFLRD
jgi:hypothetical protein